MEKPLKIVLAGAASPQWGYTLMRDIIMVLSGDSGCIKRRPVLVLEDIDGVNLEMAYRVGRMIVERTGEYVEVRSTTDLKEALAEADFVVTSLAVGALEAMAGDLEIPYEYGIFQPVGDTISVGGAIRAARNIPVFVELAKEMERQASPDAWLLNLSNPMSMLTRAVTRQTHVKAVGLCHELYGGMHLLGQWLGFDPRRWKQLARLEVVGINHCGWLRGFELDGWDAFPALRAFLEGKGITAQSRRLYDSPHPELRHHNVKMALFLRHGVFPYSGDRHNAEFFAEFVHRGTNLGADYGIRLTTIQERLVDWRGNARVSMQERLEGRKEIDLNISQEAFAKIIKAMVTGLPFFDVSNLPYFGEELPGVPQGAVIERMCRYDERGAHPERVLALPEAVQEHLALHAGIIEDVVEASVSGNRALMIGALRRDPLLGNMDPGKIPVLWDRLAQRNQPFLHPGFFLPGIGSKGHPLP